jgi:ubiquinone/menaquinone biosynthesis C-methylase UbiE
MTQDARKIDRIKDAVRKNFDQSPDRYQAFEKRHGFFRRLNDALLSRMLVQEGAAILDVGCGTGAGSTHMLDVVPNSHVWGIDISPAMLKEARESIGESDRLAFVLGDAARLTESFDMKFDAIVYSASIFLIPDYEESLKQAETLLKNNGFVGLTFLDGPYDSDGENVLRRADVQAKLGVSLKKPVNISEFNNLFGSIFPDHESWTEDFRLKKDVLEEFYSVPAMSAGLFPGLDYSERLVKIGRLFESIPEGEIAFRWVLRTGRKRECNRE